MRKKWFAALALALSSMILLTGCSLSGLFGSSDKNFPYDIAVQEGYLGTESEWLSEQTGESTVFRRMYEEALSDGSFSGTYFEFLKEVAPTGDSTPYVQRALLSVVSVICLFSGESKGSAGAGVILDIDKASGDAYILTNYHVVYSTSRKSVYSDIGVYLYGGEYEDGDYQKGRIHATFYGGIFDYDIAVLRVQGSDALKESDARAADFGDSDALTAGEPVYAIGNPDNERISVTSGIVSMELEYCNVAALNKSGYMVLPEIRIDAPVNEGNSGGGLFNAAGEFVGVVNARSSESGIVGFGYAIPGNFALACAQNLLANSGAAKLADPNITYEVAESKAVYDETRGIAHIEEKLVARLYQSGAGVIAGVRSGDTLVSGAIVRGGVQSDTVYFTRSVIFETFLLSIRKGDTMLLTVSRDGAAHTFSIEFKLESSFTAG